jgi:hypothetical protein
VDDWPGMLQWRLLVGSPIVMGKVSRLLPYPKTSRRFFWGITPLPSGVGLDESRISDLQG